MYVSIEREPHRCLDVAPPRNLRVLALAIVQTNCSSERRMLRERHLAWAPANPFTLSVLAEHSL